MLGSGLRFNISVRKSNIQPDPGITQVIDLFIEMRYKLYMMKKEDSVQHITIHKLHIESKIDTSALEAAIQEIHKKSQQLQEEALDPKPIENVTPSLFPDCPNTMIKAMQDANIAITEHHLDHAVDLLRPFLLRSEIEKQYANKMIGLFYAQFLQFEQALPFFEQTLKNNPYDWNAKRNLFITYLKTGHFEKANLIFSADNIPGSIAFEYLMILKEKGIDIYQEKYIPYFIAATEIYLRLRITDYHFVVMRGCPPFEIFLLFAVDFLNHLPDDALDKNLWFTSLFTAVDDEGKALLKDKENQLILPKSSITNFRYEIIPLANKPLDGIIEGIQEIEGETAYFCRIFDGTLHVGDEFKIIRNDNLIAKVICTKIYKYQDDSVIQYTAPDGNYVDFKIINNPMDEIKEDDLIKQ